MPVFTDQTGRTIHLNNSPHRIISLVPSQTELLYDLGLRDEVVGITKFCVHPENWFRQKTRVGGTKQLKMEIIHQLQPDLIIANKEENVKEQIEELATNYPVWISDINNLDDAFEMIETIARIINKEKIGSALITRIRKSFDQLPTPDSRLRTAYLIWREPYMTIGGDTFIHSMMEIGGFENVFKDRVRYPEITIDELSASGCQVLLLSSEPFPFGQKHMEEIHYLLPGIKIILVDGEMFSWYGSRLLQAAAYFMKLREV